MTRLWVIAVAALQGLQVPLGTARQHELARADGDARPKLAEARKAVAGRAQSTPSLQLTFIGNAAVSIVSGDRAVMTDFPYQSGAFGYMTYDCGTVRLPDRVVVLVTHGHHDHFDPTLPRGPQWRVVAPDDVARLLRRGAIGAAAAATEAPGLMVTPITSPHANVSHQSYRVEWHGRRFHFTGDTES